MVGGMIIANIGRIIVKTILSNIFNDPVADITDDFFMKISSDYMKARATRRYFESFMDKYSDNFSKIIECSPDDIEDKRLEFLVSNVEMIFREYDFSLNNLMEKSFNIDDILNDILKNKFPNPKQYSVTEWTQLCALLRLAVVFVVDVSDKLQNFAAQTARETLIQISTIKRQLNKFIEDFEKNREDLKESKTLEMSSIEMEYKKVVRTIYSKIYVFGANLTNEAKRYLLEEAYVTLNANDVNEGYSKNIHDFLNENYLLVLGEAGTGKTTFINWLATNSAIGNSALVNTSWDNKIPFVIELRKHTSTISFDTIRSLVSKYISKENTNKWIQDVFESKRAMLLIDGMDEVSAAKRREVFDWISTINSKYNVKTVITSRPSVIYDLLDEADELNQTFKLVELEPMTEELISLFILNWHNAVARNFRWNSTDSQRYSRIIYSQIRNNHSLRDLASYPLLCAMICGLWHNNGMILPKTRNEIYEACCKMLMENRDESRQIKHEVGSIMNQQQKLVIMDDIAYWMQINNYVSQKKRYVINRIKNKIQYMSPDIRAIGAEKILEYLVERSGILRNPTGKDIDFIHKTFQEYLAARVIMKNSDYGILIDKILDYNWHETVLLAMGFASKADADEIISKLLENGKKDKKFLYAAVACFNIPIELSPEIRNAVESIVQEIIPPRNDHEAKLLSSSPESIIPFLNYRKAFSLSETKLCINTLVSINTIESLNVLSEYLLKGTEKTRQYIFNIMEKISIQDIVDSQFANAIFECAVDKNNTVTINSFIARICTTAKHNIVKGCSIIKLLNTDCLVCLEGVNGLKTCEWLVSSNDQSSLYNIDLSNIKIENLIVTVCDEKATIPLLTLIEFGMLNQLTLNGLNDSLFMEQTFAFSKINGLEKIHFITKEFFFDSTICEILSYFGDRRIIIEITAENVSGIDIIDISDLECIEKVIINDKTGTHTSDNYNICDFFYHYDIKKGGDHESELQTYPL